MSTYLSVFKTRMMLRFRKSNIRIIGKYFIFCIVLLSLIFLLIDVDVAGYIWLGENFSDPYTNEKFTLGILREDLTSCFMESPKEKFMEKDIPDVHDWSKSSSFTSNRISPSLFMLLSEFNMLLSSLHIKAVIIEPSVLYCMLLPLHQKILLKRNFDISKFLGSKDILTYGILSKDVPALQEEENIHKFSVAGYRPYFVQVPVRSWMKPQTSRFGFETFSSHIFYKHRDITFHFVVFQERANYLWHAVLPDNRNRIPPKNELLFVDHNSAYERFGFVPLVTKMDSFAEIYIPSTPHYFLFQMLSSRFLECDPSRSTNISTSNNHPTAHPELSVERFNKRAITTIHQLKTMFHPLLMNLWIWSGTMLGWYRQCDIIPYTTDMDFAAWVSEVDDVTHIINLLLNNEYVTIKQRMGLLEEALEFQLDCFNLRTDIFFMYQIQNGSWCSGHSPRLGYYFRYFYPTFTLCSAELLGQKVQVPCETENVILTEYGPSWRKPVSSWSYETSTRNRGPNIYWDTKKYKNAYQTY